MGRHRRDVVEVAEAEGRRRRRAGPLEPHEAHRTDGAVGRRQGRDEGRAGVVGERRGDRARVLLGAQVVTQQRLAGANHPSGGARVETQLEPLDRRHVADGG